MVLYRKNDFFHWPEWIPVLASAFAVGFLAMATLQPFNRPLALILAWLMVLQFVVGVAGFGFHLTVNLLEEGATLRARFLYGAPVFAPLLFCTLALLAAIGLWDLWSKARARATTGFNTFRQRSAL